MKKTKRKLITYLLVVSLVLSFIPFNAFASEKLVSETYVSEELGLVLDRIVAHVKSLDGKVIHPAMEYNGQPFLDEGVIADVNPIINNELDVSKIKGSLSTKSSVTWEPWSSLNTIAACGSVNTDPFNIKH
ncbi:hypothetical protein HZF24_08155 [Sedimentibacter hydroxybenzoicus DSM 7310]|uniref:Uncharacterized protein n=1 Tax=Sedimentibacter hydroxybenzoicus DSM 7310 TaxID=1123245 RepID=A0A974BIZ3_SEDHY|nr:hypothetical protein [Sedimentibacter hydroxybenzoicus]NYB74114.1 hypothetical protein [Sedimentibacter hydroxybenzoicus DSM 7310]